MDIRDDPAQVLSVTRLAVATGIVSSSEARSDRLQLVTVKEGATIYTRADVQADVLITLNEAELEMCDLHTQDWCCVLIPGYSFGWVQAADVVGTKEWTPSVPMSPSLKGLDIDSNYGLEDSLLFLSVLGGGIGKLFPRQAFASPDILDKLMLTCPNLKSLDLGAQAVQLTQSSLERFFSRTTGALEALTIEWSRCNAPVLLQILTDWTHEEAVKRLKKLQLTNITECSLGPTDFAAFKVLLQKNQLLE